MLTAVDGAWDTLYVPTPPSVPVNWDAMNVPVITLVPDIVIPFIIVPVGVPPTDNVLKPAGINPVNVIEIFCPTATHMFPSYSTS